MVEIRDFEYENTTQDGSYFHGGESEIRTHGGFHLDGFQDRYLKPLGHLSMVVRVLDEGMIGENGDFGKKRWCMMFAV